MNIFKPNLKIIIFSIILFVINIIIILQLVPVFESETPSSKIINLIVFPPNFFFEDIFGITSIKSIDVLTWILQFIYDYIIIAIILNIRQSKK